MRIAQVSPLYESVPPSLYGGTERVVANLADALTDLGHEVTLFASADSQTKARLVPCRDTALRLDPDMAWELPAHTSMMKEVFDRRHAFDILHFHTDCLQMAFFRDEPARTLTTLHGRLDLKDLRPFFSAFAEFPLVSISNSQRAPVPFANFVATVPHGIDPGLLTPPKGPSGDYLAFLGRTSPEKGLDTAVEIARRAGLPLKIAAKVDAADRSYFDDRIAPLLDDPLVEFVGEIGDHEKSGFLGNARALLFPIRWPEPFGLVMIEAMACGTPVIASPMGSVPEVIDDGITGFIARDLDEAVEAVRVVRTLDRQAIRTVFERRFSARAMAEAYEGVYGRLLRRRTSMARMKPAHARVREPALSAPRTGAYANGSATAA